MVDEELEHRISRADQCDMMTLSHMDLHIFPQTRLFREEPLMSRIIRLDLSYNWITELPEAITECTGLIELWLQYNPLELIPAGISNLRNLECLDIASTKISELPNEMATMTKLDELDWFDTPLELTLLKENEIQVNDVPAVMGLLHNRYTRQKLEEQLLETLNGTKYMKEADLPGMSQIIRDLCQTLSNMYADLDEMALFVRRAESLLPEKVVDCTPENLFKVKSNFEEMQRDTTRVRLSADVEIKLRAIYFDRAERSEIDFMLSDIYKHVKSLEDIQHLVQYAVDIMPEEAKDVTGAVVWKNMLAHQQMLTDKREGVIGVLLTSMTGLYPEQRPADIEESGRRVAKAFAVQRFATKHELERLTQVAAEAAKLFPPDFPSIDPLEIKAAAKVMFAIK